MGEKGLKILRITTVPAIMGLIIFALIKMPPEAQLFYLVMWCNYIIIATALLSMKVSAGGASSGLRRATQMLLEYALGAEVIVTLVYWAIMFVVVLDKYANDVSMIVFMFLVNNIPTAFVAANVVLSKIRFSPGNWWFTLAVGATFMLVNFIGCKINDVVYYPFLPWDGSVKSIIMPIATAGMGVLIYVLTAVCVNKLPRERA
jgi:hypothetical protein